MEDDIIHVDDPRWEDWQVRRFKRSLRAVADRQALAKRRQLNRRLNLQLRLDRFLEGRNACDHALTGIICKVDTDMDGVLLDGERERICLDCREILEMPV